MEIETIAAPAAPAVPDGGGSGDAKPEIKAKPDADATPKGETPAERKLRLKFGKQEKEVSEQEAVALAQKGWASDEKFKSAAQMKREAEELVERADVEKMLKKKYGKDKLEWAKDVLKEELRRRALSPDELEIEDRKARLERLKQEEEEIENRRSKEKLAAAQARYEEQYDRELASAVEKHKVPKNKYVIGRAVKIAQEMVDNDLDPDWDLVVQEAKRQWQEEISESFDAEEDFSFLGERARKISKWLVSKGMSKQAAEKESVKIVKSQDKSPDSTVPVDSDEWFEKKRKAWGG